MPAEAIHLSALDDALALAGPTLGRHVHTAALKDAARLGAVFVDLPYFERIWRSMAAHALGAHSPLSSWGERFHQEQPIGLARGLLERRAALPAESADRAWLLAFLIGYASHVAVDRELHPMVNRLAEVRARGGGTTALQEHQQVEKVQSIVFHGERLGRDLLGTRALSPFLSVHAAPLLKQGPIATAFQETLTRLYGQPPAAKTWKAWAKGYASYVALLSTVPGTWVLTREDRAKARGALYDQVRFPELYRGAVSRAVRCAEAVVARAGDSHHRAFDLELPEGTLDPREGAVAAPLPPRSVTAA